MNRSGKHALLRSSTRAFIREAWRTRGYSLLDFVHGYCYARWTYLYVAVGTGEHWLGRLLRPGRDLLIGFWAWLHTRQAPAVIQRPPYSPVAMHGGNGHVTFADTYHGKVLPLSGATQLVTVNQNIHLTELEKIIPYALAHDIILRDPDHIVVMDCPCRLTRPHPCLPLDVCIVVGEPFASFYAEHHPEHSRWITPQEAVEILRAEDARGHVHHAFFKDAMLSRFYVICNCCACCCGAMQVQREGVPMLASSGYVARLDLLRCVGCGQCAAACPFQALSLQGGQIQVDKAACMGCGVCLGRCPREALALVRDASKGEPLELCELLGEKEPPIHREQAG